MVPLLSRADKPDDPGAESNKHTHTYIKLTHRGQPETRCVRPTVDPGQSRLTVKTSSHLQAPFLRRNNPSHPVDRVLQADGTSSACIKPIETWRVGRRRVTIV